MGKPDMLENLHNRSLEQGMAYLSDCELLALVLGGGAAGAQPLALARRIMAREGGLEGLARRDVLELSRLAGMGRARACLLQAALELGRRSSASRPRPGQTLGAPAEVAQWFKCQLQDCERETVHSVLLDGRGRVIRELKLGEGSWTSCQVDPKVVFAACLRSGACGLILVHNHPSGDLHPSREDVEITERLSRAGRLLEVKLLDHLIVSREGYTSLAERGLL
jgi:DNA repair protein RadC